MNDVNICDSCLCCSPLVIKVLKISGIFHLFISFLGLVNSGTSVIKLFWTCCNLISPVINDSKVCDLPIWLPSIDY